MRSPATIRRRDEQEKHLTHSRILKRGQEFESDNSKGGSCGGPHARSFERVFSFRQIVTD